MHHYRTYGSIVEQGQHNVLLVQQGVYAKLWELQQKNNNK